MEEQKKKLLSFSVYSLLSISYGAGIALLIVYFFLFLFSIFTNTEMPVLYDLDVHISQSVKIPDNVVSNSQYILNTQTAEIVILNPTLYVKLLGMLLTLLTWGGFTYGIVLLRKLIKNIHKNLQFCSANIRYTRLIGWMIIIIPHLIVLIKNIIISTIPGNTVIEGFRISRQISGFIQIFSLAVVPEYILFGFVVIVFAEVFKEGNRIKQENDLTV